MIIAQTDRLIIRQINTDDFDDLSLVLADPEVMVYSTVGVHTPKQIEGFIGNVTSNYQKQGYGHFALYHKQTGEFIGLCGLNKHQIDNIDMIHIMYRIRIQYQGMGYATEASSGVLEFAKNTLKLPLVYAVISPTNTPSINVVDRLGFTKKKSNHIQRLYR